MSKISLNLKILYCESDSEVLASHSAAISKAGHQVENVIGRKAAEEALRRECFDLVLLGSTLSKNDRHHLPYMARKAHEGTKVLVARTGGHHHEVDATVDGERGVEVLLQTIASLFAQSLSVPAKTRAATAGR